MSPSVSEPAKSWRARLDSRGSSLLPYPAYQRMVSGYTGMRRLAGRSPGRDRVLPDFLIIGFAKAGTTSLYGWMCEHPFVAPAARKEVHFFDHSHFRGFDWYRTHFPRELERRAFAERHGRPFISGEASPNYVSHYWVPARVAGLLPDAKLIVALRDPIDRAYSHFQMSRRYGEDPLETFEEAVELEDQRLASERARWRTDPRYKSWRIGAWEYLTRSRYAEQLEPWLELFRRDQFHFLTIEELSANPHQTLDAVHEFLGLPAHRAEGLRPLHTASYESLGQGTRDRLQEYFRPHNERLYELVGRDLGWDRPVSRLDRIRGIGGCP